MENSVVGVLLRYRCLIVLPMVVASLVNAVVRFPEGSRDFWALLFLQALFGQAVFAYLYGGWIAIGPGSLPKKDNSTSRAVLAGIGFVAYLISFGLDGVTKKESVHDRRSSDWAMPTREEIGRSSENAR